ncbi:type II toxin-antitoxin system HicA family toxin [Streptomyces sp. NPDC047000]|uniref:type II toxin-antitoxin system HicA family toxin n=1 Tax=Streptomyces sp. NPDC047000 TaxID=3155474 RepID=UPI0033DE577C
MSKRSRRARFPDWPCSAGDVVRCLTNNGFTWVRTRGSHFQLTNGTGCSVTVPNQPVLAKGTYWAIRRRTRL